MTEPGLTDEDFRKIREAVESDAYSMAETLTDNSKRNPNFATHEVGARECALIRCMRGCGKSNREIIDATGFCEKTVRLHATGRCSHSEPVPAPPTVLREGPHTEGIDHEKTRERRREWREEKTVAPGAARQVMTDGGHQRPKFSERGERYHPTRGEDEPSGWDYYECPDCGASVCTLCDCPECGWYDADLWREAIREAVQVHDDVWTGDVSVETATDGGRAELPHRGTSHYGDDSDETVYERADKVVRRCRGDVNKYCAWSMSYEGDELDAILKPNGCIDADAVDRRCPLCGGPVEEDYFGHDDREGVPK